MEITAASHRPVAGTKVQVTKDRTRPDYQRADQRIQEDICDRLTDDDRIDASDIDVKVTNGEVTLTGTLRSRNAKRWAIQIAEQTSGVKDVHTSIRVSDEQRRLHTY